LHPFFIRSVISIILVHGFVLYSQSAETNTQTTQPAPDAQQKAAETAAPRGSNPVESSPKRIFGIIPNYRTSPSLEHYQPLTTPQKFKIASQDAFDRGTFILAAAFAGESELTHADRSFGDGVPEAAKYFVTSYADYAIGDMMTEAIYPSLLHQDPRYFRKGTGGVWGRLGYAAGQLFWTHTDSGGFQFNYSEVVGNATAVAISNAYYPESRDVTDGITKLGTQLAVDLGSNILKEFSPDIYRKFRRKRR
jgi:hypothetical protein